MIDFSFRVPSWMLWLVPNRRDHQRRATLTGRSSRSYFFNLITIEARERD